MFRGQSLSISRLVSYWCFFRVRLYSKLYLLSSFRNRIQREERVEVWTGELSYWIVIKLNLHAFGTDLLCAPWPSIMVSRVFFSFGGYIKNEHQSVRVRRQVDLLARECSNVVGNVVSHWNGSQYLYRFFLPAWMGFWIAPATTWLRSEQAFWWNQIQSILTKSLKNSLRTS